MSISAGPSKADLSVTSWSSTHLYGWAAGKIFRYDLGLCWVLPAFSLFSDNKFSSSLSISSVWNTGMSRLLLLAGRSSDLLDPVMFISTSKLALLPLELLCDRLQMDLRSFNGWLLLHVTFLFVISGLLLLVVFWASPSFSLSMTLFSPPLIVVTWSDQTGTSDLTVLCSFEVTLSPSLQQIKKKQPINAQCWFLQENRTRQPCAQTWNHGSQTVSERGSLELWLEAIVGIRLSLVVLSGAQSLK